MNPDRARASVVTASLLLNLLVASFAFPAFAGEGELDDGPAASSTDEIETPIRRVFPKTPTRPRLLPWLQGRLEELPPFFSDMKLEARFRTYYLRAERTSGRTSEAWAMGGSISYQSGWLRDLFAVEVEGFTSQPIVAPERREGTLLLEPVQDGYNVLGIANAKLRHKGIVLTGFRQYLDLPFVNRNDSRMTPNTFESVTLAKPDGKLRFSAGYTWRVKLRNSDEFESMTKAIGLDEDRGLAHAGAVWDVNDDFRIGAIAAAIPDVLAGFYTESNFERELSNGWQARLDSQFAYRGETGDDLLGGLLDDTWNFAIRASASRAGLLVRLGGSITGSGGSIDALFGSSPSYVDLMQRGFVEANVKALLASVSYDFAGVGVEGLSAIVNFVAAFDGKSSVRGSAQEVDLTVDYRIEKGWLKNLWLRVRGSWLNQEFDNRDGTDFRVILRYDLPVI